MRRQVALAMALGLVVACRHDGLPPEITIEQVVTELGPPLAPGAAVEGTTAGVTRAVLRPGERPAGGGPLDAVVTPPPSTLRFHVPIPPDTTLRFGVGVDGDKQRHPDRSGVLFRVAVDGHEVFSRVVNPAARRKDRRWVEGRIDLRPWADRSVELTLETRAERIGQGARRYPGMEPRAAGARGASRAPACGRRARMSSCSSSIRCAPIGWVSTGRTRARRQRSTVSPAAASSSTSPCRRRRGRCPPWRRSSPGCTRGVTERWARTRRTTTTPPAGRCCRTAR